MPLGGGPSARQVARGTATAPAILAGVGCPIRCFVIAAPDSADPAGGDVMNECDWTRCAAPARLDVLLGESLVEAMRIGSFCVPHASLCSIDTQDRAGKPTWYDWHRPGMEAALAGAAGEWPARGVAGAAAATVIPLFRGGNGHRGRHQGAPTWAGADAADS
jgi:hypothetical protein